MRKRTTWILIADGARARIVLSEGWSSGLERALDYDFAVSHVPTRTFGTDRPGRTFGSADGSRHAVEPRVDWHEYEKHLFAVSMAKVLDEAAERGAFDRLVLVAPPKTLGALRAALKPRTRKMVIAEVGKDLTHVPVRGLTEHLRDVVPLNPRVPSRGTPGR